MEILHFFLFELVFLLLGITTVYAIAFLDSERFLIYVKKWSRLTTLKYAIGFIGSIYLTLVIIQHFYSNQIENLHLQISTSNHAGYLAFFASALTAIYIYQTLSAQKSANQIAAFENRLFKFIDYHRDNVAQLRYRKPQTEAEEYFVGNQVFTVIYYEIIELLKEYIEKKYDNQNISIVEKCSAIDFVYQCIFYGAGQHSFPIVNSKFSKELTFIDFRSRLAAYTFNGKRHKYYTGHVRRLGHYFRNIYQAIKYVDEQTFLTPDQKYEYVTILRAQMSVYEQAVFFFNSISDFGGVWEWDYYNRMMPNQSEKKSVFKKLWITKYDLIRNTLNNDGYIMEGVTIGQFYPLLVVEREHECGKYGQFPFKETNNNQFICRFCFNEKYIGNENKNILNRLKNYLKDHPNFNNEFKCEEPECVTKKALAAIK